MAKKKKFSVEGCLTTLFSAMFIGMVCILGISIIVYGFEYLFGDDTESTKEADGFTISAYNVILDVNEDNKVDVTENITVNWNESDHHGIYKLTPEWLQYTDKDGNTIKRKSIVSDYRAEGEEYSVETVKKKQQIKIGSASEYVPLGEKTYTIKYTYDMGKDPFKGFDEFIFHTYGDYWGTKINNATLEVNMPKNIEEYNINFFKDKKRKENVNSLVDYSVNGNTLYAEYKSQEDSKNYKPLYKSLTVDIELPEGYFTGGSWNYGWGSFAISTIIFLLTIITIINWIRFGKDYPKKPTTIEFYPPENLSSAEIGYIYGNKESKKLTISLIVQIAAKGYIKIDQIDEKEIQITNLCPKSGKSMPSMTKLEKIVYDRLFESEDIVILSKHQTFYKAFYDVSKSLMMDLQDKIQDKIATSKKIWAIISNIIIIILSIYSYAAVEDLDPKFKILYVLSFICIIVNFVFVLIMKRKTEYGEQIIAKVKGFRQFMDTAEKTKLESIVSENSKYFYDILPYAYVLGVSKKWINLFEDIPMPKIDMGSYRYDSDLAYYMLYNNVYFPESTSSSSGDSSSGCSSCGGGCSSCGGGGSW